MNRPFLKFLVPTKRKLVPTAILFLFLVFFLPTITCVEDFPTSAKVCKAENLCTTDLSFTLAQVITGYEEGEFHCPTRNLSWGFVLGLAALFLIGAYLASCAGDHLYGRYRDI